MTLLRIYFCALNTQQGSNVRITSLIFIIIISLEIAWFSFYLVDYSRSAIYGSQIFDIADRV